jgi:hypothetical protein
MKLAISIGVAVVLPFGFLVLAGIIVNHVLAKRRQARPAQLQTPSVSTERQLHWSTSGDATPQR